MARLYHKKGSLAILALTSISAHAQGNNDKPILLLLSVDIGLSAAVGNFVFGVPLRGSLVLLYVSGMLHGDTGRSQRVALPEATQLGRG